MAASQQAWAGRWARASASESLCTLGLHLVTWPPASFLLDGGWVQGYYIDTFEAPRGSWIARARTSLKCMTNRLLQLVSIWHLLITSKGEDQFPKHGANGFATWYLLKTSEFTKLFKDKNFALCSQHSCEEHTRHFYPNSTDRKTDTQRERG